jgi:hypothetical protein
MMTIERVVFAMALTATKVVDEVPGAARLIAGTITFDASYTTGGLAVTSTLLGYTGGSTVVWMAVTGIRGAAGTAASGVQFNAATQKLLVYNTTAGAETANATSLATLVCDYLALVR